MSCDSNRVLGKSRPIVALMCGLTVFACVETRNAVCEITVPFSAPFPQNPDGTGRSIGYARIRVASGIENVAFDDVFTDARATEVFALGQERRVTVIGQEAQFGRSLRILVDYCADSLCSEVVFSRRFELERAFYRAKYTGITLTGTDVPATIRAGGAPVLVERCALFGCVPDFRANYCTNGVHACE